MSTAALSSALTAPALGGQARRGVLLRPAAPGAQRRGWPPSGPCGAAQPPAPLHNAQCDVSLSSLTPNRESHARVARSGGDERDDYCCMPSGAPTGVSSTGACVVFLLSRNPVPSISVITQQFLGDLLLAPTQHRATLKTHTVQDAHINCASASAPSCRAACEAAARSSAASTSKPFRSSGSSWPPASACGLPPLPPFSAALPPPPPPPPCSCPSLTSTGPGRELGLGSVSAGTMIATMCPPAPDRPTSMAGNGSGGGAGAPGSGFGGSPAASATTSAGVTAAAAGQKQTLRCSPTISWYTVQTF